MEVVTTRVNELSAWMVPQLVIGALAGSLLVLMAAAWLRFFPGRSASTRHFIWLLAIVTPLCLPIATWLLPGWNLGPINWSGLGSDHVIAKHHPSAWPAVTQTAGASAPSASRLARPAGATAQSSIQLSGWTLLLGFWLLGVMVPTSRWVIGVIRLGRLGRRAGEPTAPLLHTQLDHAISQLRISRPVCLLVSTERAMPMQWGIFRPKVLLPAAAMNWHDRRIRSVLLHELAHIARRDSLTRRIAMIAASLLWFNPMSWYAYRRLGNECELACDDLTINTGCDPCDYAETLLIVSRWSRESRLPLFPALEMSTTSMLETRVRAILSPSRNRGSVCRRTSIGASVVASSIVCGLAMLQGDDATARPTHTSRTTAPTDAGSASSQSDAPRLSDKVITLSHVDDSAEGRRSLAGSGHAVRFELPARSRRHADQYLLAVEIYASRYGHEQPPREDFHVYVLDQTQRLIAAFPIAYATIQRGHERWYTLPITPTAIPRQFFVALTFNPHRTKGIYMAYDQRDEPSHSFVGRPTSGLQPLGDGRNWMIRAVIASTDTPPNPFD